MDPGLYPILAGLVVMLVSQWHLRRQMIALGDRMDALSERTAKDMHALSERIARDLDAVGERIARDSLGLCERLARIEARLDAVLPRPQLPAAVDSDD